MKTLGKVGLGLVGIVAALAGVVAYRTATFKPATAVDITAVKLAASVPVDQAKAAQHLSESIRFLTISHQDKAENDWSQWDGLHAWLATTYPAVHKAMVREILPNKALVYTWKGSDPALAPIVLMAHQDVVPVTAGTEKDWKHPPFEGVIAENAVWGRGSIDDKGSLVTIFESLEALAASGFQPKRTVIVVSGQDEEAGGTGAQAAAALFKQRGVKAEWVLDEGMAVVKDFPMVGKPVAVVGLGEKGYATLKIVAKASGGHSSAPPKETGVETLSKAILAITGSPFPLEFKGPGADMIRAIAPETGLMTRVVVANTWLFGGLLKSQLAKSPASAATLHTTIAPTMLKGSPKENVLPQDATAWINYRIAPGQTRADVMARAKAATKGLAVDLSWEAPGGNDPSPVSSTSSEGWKLLAALASDGGKTPVAPGLVTAGTDSRYMTGVAKDVYRFAPMHASIAEFGMIHGTNEHMSLENLRRMTDFYTRLIATAAG
ncbi:M20 family peptidase [Caulobacter mirabilis]|uniref:Peptidase M20 n=1 Tax=Caulobacter mirabilis TaxID=69666 RepID=A0A2D2ATF8_9CAUL|nr:M20 family peptidase [Caulobacter mirabilis]ATQ41302.1 peptidase M20 [Caulobacter mirabilis]